MESFFKQNGVKNLPCFSLIYGRVREVGHPFIDMTGYSENDFLGKSIDEIQKLLKINANVYNLAEIEDGCCVFIFSKSLSPKEVIVTVHKGSNEEETIYNFYEKPASKIESLCPIFNQIYIDNVVGAAVYSYPELLLLKANQLYLDMYSEPYNESKNILGLRVEDCVSKGAWSEFNTIWQSVIDTGNSYRAKEYKINKLNGEECYYDFTLTPVKKGDKLKYIVAIVNDVSDKILGKKRIEEQARIIKQQKDELEAVIENMADAVFVFDKDGRYYIQNKAAREYFPQKHLDKVGGIYALTKFYDSNGVEISLNEMPLFRAMKGEIINSERLTMVYGDMKKHFSVSGAPVYDSEGNLRVTVICSREMTEQVTYYEMIKAQQEALLKAEREKNEAQERTLKIKDDFFSFISHEFKMPLTVINAAIQTMEVLCSDEITVRAKRYIQRIRQNVFRQLRLVNNLLDISRAESGYLNLKRNNLEIVSLTKNITESVAVYAKQKGISITFTSVILERVIAIDDEKYERILLNLLSNAIKFTPPGKSIHIRVFEKNQRICVGIEDEGVGIPKSKQSIIFDRFGQVNNELTRQSEGTGIGLALVKMLVNSMNGDIDIKSEEGAGSVFTISLPITCAEDIIEEKVLPEIKDNRLIQAVAIEFSDIYL